MDNETLRTLITSITSIVTVSITVWFALKSQQRREKIDVLEKHLSRAYTEFKLLYKTEVEYLKDLEELTPKSAHQLKIDKRKIVTDRYGDEKISLTPDKIKKLMIELALKN